MKVITKNPIIQGNPVRALANPRDRIYSALDASSSSDEISKFQTWMGTAKGINYFPDQSGKFGPKTLSAYQQYGKEYDNSVGKKAFDLSKIFGGINKGEEILTKGKDTVEFGKGILGKGNTGAKSTVSTKPTEPSGDDHKGMSATTKVLIGTGIVVGIGAVIYAIKKGKFKKK